MDIKNKIEVIASLSAAKDEVARLMEEHEQIKLHIGCGTVYKDGWINIDNNSDSNISRIDLPWDLRMPLPFPKNSVDFIYNEHFLEHLSVEEALRSLKDFRRILKLGGVVRIAMPDLKGIISAYMNPNSLAESQPFLKKFGLDFVKTRAEMLNINFRWWGHQWLYDWEELERRLHEAGFTAIVQCWLYKSGFEDLCNLESREESTLIAEAMK